MDWLPSKRPPGNGVVARLWDVSTMLGTTVPLAAVTFIAYLIASFLEMDSDGLSKVPCANRSGRSPARSISAMSLKVHYAGLAVDQLEMVQVCPRNRGSAILIA
jgi:hypothetical protein